MFQFPGFALIPLWIQRISPFTYDLLPVNGSEPRTPSRQWSRPHSQFAISQFANPSTDNRSQKVGSPIRKFTDQSLFAAPHDLSQRTTSFIASQRQGIHRIPLRHLIALIARTRFGHAPKMSRRFEKTSFASNASGIRAVRLQITTGMLELQMNAAGQRTGKDIAS